MQSLHDEAVARRGARRCSLTIKLAGKEWSELFATDQAGMNNSGLVYPKYPAPVVIAQDGVETPGEDALGMPSPVFPSEPGAKPMRQTFITNIRNTASGHWKPMAGRYERHSRQGQEPPAAGAS